MEREEAAAGRAWRRRLAEAICDEIGSWEFGTVVRAHRYPDTWDYNALYVERPPDDLRSLLEAADDALADCRHRLITFEVPLPESMERDLEQHGWIVPRLVWMLHEGDVPPAGKVAVGEADHAAIRHLRRDWHLEDFPGYGSVDAFLDQSADVDARLGGRVLTVEKLGHTVGFAIVCGDERDSEVAQVYVSPAHRGAGLGEALTAAAIRTGAGAAQLWICADQRGRPRRLYARLGFRESWSTAMAIRLPVSPGP